MQKYVRFTKLPELEQSLDLTYLTVLSQKDAQSRIARDGIVIYEGELASLKRFKDDVKEVKSGFECGIVFEKYNDIKEGDQIEAFVMEEIPR